MKSTTWFCLVFSLLLSYAAQAQPSVNLGADTTVCGNSLNLDAGNLGASFIWSTGATTQSITATASDIYWVDVTDLSGTTRDSIDVTLVRQAIYTSQPNDMTLCGGLVNLTASVDTGSIRWIDSTGNTLSLGNTFMYNLTNTSTIWYQSDYYTTIGRTFAQGGSGYPTASRAIIFDVQESIRLNSVMIDINGGPFTADIELEDNTGSVIASKSISYNAAGRYEVALGFEIPVGANYRLYMRNISGGGVRTLFPYSNWAADHTYGFINLTNSTDPTVYPIFWEWNVTRLDDCITALDSVTLTMLPTPVADLGADTALCGGTVTLDATNPGVGFSYLWNTNANTAAITVNTTGTYIVTVTLGGNCPVSDSINVVINAQPTILQAAADATVCKGLQEVIASVNAGLVVWKDTSGNIVGLGDTLLYNVIDTTTLYYQASYIDEIGRSFAQGGSSYPSVNRGIIFDVQEMVQLNNVMIETNGGPFTADIELENSSGTVIASKSISYNAAGRYEVALDFVIPTGTDYTLYMRNISGGGVYSLFPYSNWAADHDYGYIQLTNSTDPTVYPIFWEWKVSKLDGCISAIDTVTLNSLPTPTVDLGADTVVCADTLVLDATNLGTGFTYLWSTTENTSTIQAFTTGWYKVTVTQGGVCSVEDSLLLTVNPRPTIVQRLADTSLCRGIQALVPGINIGNVRWLDSLGNTVALEDTLTYNLLDTTTLYYQAINIDNIGRTFAQGGSSYPSVSRGIIFDAQEMLRLNSVMIEINGGPFTADIELENSSGTVIANKSISYNSAGRYEVFLDFEIPAGSDYTLYMRNISGGGVYSLFPYSNWAADHDYGYIQLKNSTDPTVYPIFWEWKVSKLDGCTSEIDSVTLSPLPTPIVDLGADTVLCSDTLILDATNLGTGFIYLWSTTENTPTIQALTTGLYKVTVSQGGNCPVEDSLLLTVNTRPTIAQRPADRSLCEGIHDLVASAGIGEIRWMDSLGNTIAFEDTLTYHLLDTTTLYYQAVNMDHIGRTFAQGGSSYPTVSRGIIFDVQELVQLNSVMIEINGGPFTADIELENSSGTVIANKSISYSSAGRYEVFLDFVIPAGSDYTLYMRNISGGGVHSLFPYSNWAADHDYGYIQLTNSTDPTVYPIFWEWKVNKLDGCTSEMDSVTLNSLLTPVIDLGVDTVLCGGALTLDATNPGASYLYNWSTSATTPTIQAASSALYKVTVSVGGTCPVEDSLNLVVNERPAFLQPLSDTILCGGLSTFNVATNNVGLLQWTSATGTTLGYGNNFMYNLMDTTTLFYEASYVDTIGRNFSDGGSSYPTVSGRGIIFNALEPIRLNSVHINIDNGPFTATIELENAAGTVIATKNIAYSSAGTYEVFLDFDIAAGNNYTLYLRNVNGAGVLTLFPYNSWASDHDYGYIQLINATDPTVYPAFWEWKVTRMNEFCSSGKDSFLLSMLPTPILNLATDTVVCNDSIVLDVFFPNASYSWSTGGITTSSILITQEGNYSVTSTIGTCSKTDTIEVFLTPEPSINLSSSDTITCVGPIPRIATGADVVQWYDNAMGGNLLGTGSTFMYNAQVTDTIWVQGQDFSNKTYIQGLVDTFVAAQSNYYYPTIPRGIRFETHEHIQLNSVVIYLKQSSLTGQVQLWDENDIAIDSANVFAPFAGRNTVFLNFSIPEGQNYKLILKDYNQVEVLSERTFNDFPIDGDFVTLNAGTPNPTIYNYFYEWDISTLSCPSDRIPSRVEVLPTPDIDFPTDSVICGDTLILDASSLGLQSYLWSTGETSSSIILDSTIVISLVGGIGSCTDEDSMNVFIVEPPSLIIPPNDTTVCQGNVTLYASGNAAYYAWYDTETSAVPFSLGDSVLINLQDTTTLWVEGIGFIPKSTPIGEQYNPSSNLNTWGSPQNSIQPTRGLRFNINSPILLNSVAIYVDTITTATLTIYKTGFPYYTQQLNLNNAGENTVQIDTLLDVGSYTIELSNKSAGRILYLRPYTNFSQLNTSGSEVTFLGSFPFTAQYVYFFNWKISTPSCATNRLPVHITVPPSPQISLAADTATCTLANITLDPILNNNPAYAYRWSDGSSADTLSVSSSGYYKVTVTNDSACSSIKDIYVQFLSTPNDPNVSDFSICAPQNIDIPVPINDGIVVWYDSSDLNTTNYLTAPYNVYIGDTSDFWIDVAPKATTRIGNQVYDNPNESSAYLNFIIPNRFDVHEYAVLDSVAIYVETVPATVSIVLMDSLGNAMNSLSYTVTRAREKVFIPLNFLVPPGENYQLSFSSINSLFLVDRRPIAVPSSSANIATLTGTIFNDYSYFFDWHFSYAYPDCHSNGDTFTVNVSIPVDIPDSIYTCDSVTIDATHPNIISYDWSNGLTTGIATFYNAGTYTLTITDGAICTVIDTVTITQPMPVGLPAGNAACDFQLTTNYNSSNASFTWSTGDTTAIVTIPSTGIYAVSVTTNEGCLLTDTAFISQIISPPMPNLGNFVSACYTDTLDAGYGGQGMTYLWNTNAITQNIIVNTAGVYSVTVTHPLGCTGTDFVSVTIDTAPNAAFTITTSGRTVLMNNLSTGTNQATDYFWEMGDGTTYQIPNPFHTYVDSGCYLIRLTVTDACGSDTDTLRVAIDVPDSSCTINVNAIPNTSEGMHLSVVPNPNTGYFQLQLSEGLTSETRLELYDLNGRVVYEQELPLSAQTNWDIQTTNLPTGVYFLRLLNKKQSQTHRVLILRE